MELRNLIKKVISEALGVPNNLYETSVELYEKILPELKDIDRSSLDSENTYVLSLYDKFRIADFYFNKIVVEIRFYFSKEIQKPLLFGYSVNQQTEQTSNLKYKIIKSQDINLSILLAIPENYDFDELTNFFISEKKELIQSFSHELKHAYDSYKEIYDNPYERALYSGVARKKFGIKPIDIFLHDIYYVLVTENLVRPSEVEAAIRNNDISQKEFLNFLKTNETYVNLKRISEFSYDNLKEELSNYMKEIDNLLNELKVYNIDDKTDDEKIDEVLRLVMVNVSNWTLEKFQELLVSSFFERIMGLSGEKQRMLERFAARNRRFKSAQEFFEYYEKLFRYVGKNMIKKIAKLYAMTKK